MELVDQPNQDPTHVPAMHNEAPPPPKGAKEEVVPPRPPPLSAAHRDGQAHPSSTTSNNVPANLATAAQPPAQSSQSRDKWLINAHRSRRHCPNMPGWPLPNLAAPTASPNYVLVEYLPSDVASSKSCGSLHQAPSISRPGGCLGILYSLSSLQAFCSITFTSSVFSRHLSHSGRPIFSLRVRHFKKVVIPVMF